MEKEKLITRRTFFKRSLQFWLSGLFLTSFFYTYSRYIEPKRVRVNKIVFSSTKIPSPFHGITLLQFSDTHLGYDYTLKQLEKLVADINRLKPDVILFTGDLIDDPKTFRYSYKIAPILKRLHAPLGKFAIYGNHDHGGFGTERYKAIMDEAGFRLLINEHASIERQGESIHLFGIDDVMFKRHELKRTLARLSNRNFNVLLAHEPDIADDVEPFLVDVQLSGHSHGGQIQLPFIGPLITPPLAKKYVDGLYHIGRSRMTLYVNRGIGTTREPYRFLCSPELTVITLNKT